MPLFPPGRFPLLCTRLVLLLGVAWGVQACDQVTVTGALVAKLDVTPPNASVVAGRSVLLTAALTDADGNRLGGRDISWEVEDDRVAAVEDGLVVGLAPGTTLVRAIAEGTSGSARVTVLKAPSVGLSTPVVSFSGAASGPDPAPQVVAVFNDGSGTLTELNATTEYGAGAAGWLTAALAGTSAPTTLTVSVTGTALEPGVYGAEVEVGAAAGSSARLSVTFTVGESAPVIALSDSEVVLETRRGGAAPPEVVTVTNAGGQALSGLGAGIVYGEGSGTGWLTASLSPTTAPAELLLAADAEELGVGTYRAEVYVTAAAALNSPARVLVRFEVTEPPPSIGIEPASLTFDARKGEPAPDPQAVSVSNIGGGVLSQLGVSVDYGSTQPGWLSANLDQTIAPATVTVSANQADLPPGSYAADVIVESPVAENGPLRIETLLLVSNAAAVIVLGPTALDFAAVTGDADPNPALVQVSNGGGGTLTGLSTGVVYADGQPDTWLTATLAAAQAPTTLSVAPTVAGLPPGSYSATVLVESGEAGVLPSYLPVGLVVGSPPKAPTDLSAAATSATTVSLSWTDNSDDEDGFELARRSGGSAWSLVAVLTTNQTAYEDTNLTPATTYDYRVSACKDAICSTPSDPASATTPSVAAPPAPPSGLTATATAQGVIGLTWTDASDDETSFELDRSEDGGGTWATLTQTGPDVTEHTDSGLPPSTPFWYRVRACNGVGCSADSPVATATTLDPPPPPAAPTALGAVVVDHTRVDLAWTDASDSEDSFELERSADGGASWSTIATTGPDAVGHSDTSVAAETEYWYRVRACLLGQCSAYSNVATATTPVAPTPPAAPSGLVATPVSRSRIDLAWIDNSDDEDRFEIQWRRGSSGTWQFQASVGPDQTAFSATGLRKNTPYQFRVRACNDVGCSTWILAQATTPK